MGKITFQPEDDERKPDKPKPDQAGLVERLVIDQDTDQKLQGGRDVLQDAYHRKGNLPGGRGEHQQWDCGDQTSADQKEIHPRAMMQERASTGRFDKKEVDQSKRESNRRLERQTVERAKRRQFFDKAIKAE